MSQAYKDAGVDIASQDAALDRIKKLVASTSTDGVLSELGSFGGLFRPDLRGIGTPVLVASADGVGTKMAVARLAGDFSTVGGDLVNHCVNDILVQGATPLFFLDYVGTGTLDPDAVVSLIGGVASACRDNACALLGGELAEMPGFYQPGDHELVGFIVGMADASRILDGSRIEAGDVLVGLPSAGLHTNGYSLARRVLFDRMGLGVGDRIPGVDDRRTVGEHLLAPHLSYLPALRPLLGHDGLRGLAHITGGGLTDNVPRILPPDTQAFIRIGSWPIPPLFGVLQEHGEVSDEEMFQVFNMGVGMVAVVAPDALRDTLRVLREHDVKAATIGTVSAGGSGVVYDYGIDAPDGVPADGLGPEPIAGT